MTDEFTEDSPICAACAGDVALDDRIRGLDTEDRCASCGQMGPSVRLGTLAEWVEEVFMRDFSEGEYYRTAGGHTQEGEWPVDIVERIAQVDFNLAQVIVDQFGGPFMQGEPVGIDSTTSYVEHDQATYPYLLHETWREFSRKIRFGRRFFADDARDHLEQLLTDIEDFPGVDRPVEVLEPESSPFVYRARFVRTEEDAQQVIDNPRRELGPPPPNVRKGGRLNPPGVSTFYGAFSEATCVAEVRPFVGGRVVVGKFEVIRSLRVLDLTAFQRQWPEVSRFASEYEKVLPKWKFLRSLNAIVSQPVQPHEEFLQYVPTQAVAEFLQEEHGYDGLIYSSAQRSGRVGQEGEGEGLTHENIAFFDARRIVEGVPLREPEESGAGPIGSGSPATFLDGLDSDSEVHDSPEPALSLVEEATEVYQVTAVGFDWEVEHLLPSDHNPDF